MAEREEVGAWQTAWIIAEQYGPEGVDFAAQMARSFQIGGKITAQREWLAIMQMVEALVSMDNSNGAMMQ